MKEKNNRSIELELPSYIRINGEDTEDGSEQWIKNPFIELINQIKKINDGYDSLGSEMRSFEKNLIKLSERIFNSHPEEVTKDAEH